MCNGLFERSEAAALAEFMKAEKIFVSQTQRRRTDRLGERASERPECVANAYLLTSRLNAGTARQWQWHRLRTMRTNLAAGIENKQIPKSSSHVLELRLLSVDARARARTGGESK